MTLTEDFLLTLHCPYCGSSLDLETRFPSAGAEIRHGVLRCQCYRYVVVDGIVDLRQGPPLVPQDVRDFQKLLQDSDEDAAVTCILEANYRSPTPRVSGQRVLDFLERGRIPFARVIAGNYQKRRIQRLYRNQGISFGDLVTHLYPKLHASYLFHRYANPSFLAAHALLPLFRGIVPAGEASEDLLPDSDGLYQPSRLGVTLGQSTQKHQRRVLDLGCGTGHLTFRMCQMFPELEVVAIDMNFINLFVAQSYLTSCARYVCVDAEFPLPFADSFFDGVFCLDAFHYIRSKAALVRDLNRIVTPNGTWLFSHLHNSLAENISPGTPLSPEAYLQCFASIRPRLFPESGVLRQFVERQNLNLRAESSETELIEANAFCLVGNGQENLWHEHGGLVDSIYGNASVFVPNPLYRVRNERGQFALNMAWPNHTLMIECAALSSYLPTQTAINPSLWARIALGFDWKTDPEIRALLNTFQIVNLPEGYSAAIAR